jgi:hypothetical protein
MTTFYIKTPNKRIQLIEALETIMATGDFIEEVEEINILDDLTKEDYDRAFRLNATKPKSSSLIKYL